MQLLKYLALDLTIYSVRKHLEKGTKDVNNQSSYLVRFKQYFV